METRVAKCACGQLTAQCQGDPDLVSLCNCTACQRRTGSVFGVVALFDEARVRIDGQAGTFNRTSDSGYDVRFSFCPMCGSTVFWRPERKPGMIAVATGCFADDGFPVPAQSVHEEHKAPWVGFSLD